MLLNCIILGATTLFIFYKAAQLDMVDEGYDEIKRNRQGAIGWFITAIFVGILALPVMVLREVYQWLHRWRWSEAWRRTGAVTVAKRIT